MADYWQMPHVASNGRINESDLFAYLSKPTNAQLFSKDQLFVWKIPYAFEYMTLTTMFG